MSVATAYITDISAEDTRARRFGLLNAMFGAGFIVGPVLGGALGDHWVRLPFIAAAVLNAGNLLLAFVALPESREPTSQKIDLAALNPLVPLRWLLSVKSLWPITPHLLHLQRERRGLRRLLGLVGQRRVRMERALDRPLSRHRSVSARRWSRPFLTGAGRQAARRTDVHPGGHGLRSGRPHRHGIRDHELDGLRDHADVRPGRHRRAGDCSHWRHDKSTTAIRGSSRACSRRPSAWLRSSARSRSRACISCSGRNGPARSGWPSCWSTRWPCRSCCACGSSGPRVRSPRLVSCAHKTRRMLPLD